MKKVHAILFLWIIIAPFALMYAQEDEINKEVRVIKNYEPVISDADKIPRDPAYTDTTKIQPTIRYSISPVKHTTSFDTRPIKPARLVGVALDELYNYHLKLGIGNYLTPLAELSYNNLRSREFSFGADAYHKSSLAKIKLANDDKVYAGYADNNLGLQARYLADENVFAGKFGLSANTHHFYGYNTDLFSDSLPSFENSDIRQRHNYIFGEFSARSNYTDTLRLKYHLNLHLGHFYDFYDARQSNVIFEAGLNKDLSAFNLGGDIKWEQYQSTTAPDSVMGGILHVSPWLKMQEDDFLLKLGLSAVSDIGQSGFYIYPNALIEFKIVDRVLLPYMGASGELQANNYYQLVQQNPYLKSNYHHPYRTDNKITGFAGFKGNLSSRAFYNLGASFGLYDDYIFFLNDTSDQLQNQFITETTDNSLTKITYTGELQFDVTDDFGLQGILNIYKYTPGDEKQEPWHLPQHEFSVIGQYHFRDKLNAQIQVLGVGKRKAPDYLTQETITLNPILDINLAVEYKYTRLLSLYLDINNLTASKYYRWHQYPSQRLNIIVGASYKF
ncbi:MAG: hypothetical protein GVY19_09835 [Bacteroidetes bacterium]|nr:hypothetical protein [Bacteroidota bacterium]